MKKGRIWGSIGYTESLKENWIKTLTDTGLEIAISPLHDKDFNETGETKKAHYHVIFKYDGPTTENVVKNLCESVGLINPVKLESLRGSFRYHLHLDNPEKYQYPESERILLNGFDTAGTLSNTDVNKLKNEIIGFILDNDIQEYSDLIDILFKDDLTDLLDIATTHTIFFNTYITSRRHKSKS